LFFQTKDPMIIHVLSNITSQLKYLFLHYCREILDAHRNLLRDGFSPQILGNLRIIIFQLKLLCVRLKMFAQLKMHTLPIAEVLIISSIFCILDLYHCIKSFVASYYRVLQCIRILLFLKHMMASSSLCVARPYSI
jgi:hypothetical protein